VNYDPWSRSDVEASISHGSVRDIAVLPIALTNHGSPDPAWSEEICVNFRRLEQGRQPVLSLAFRRAPASRTGHPPTMPTTDDELIRALIPQWYAARAWAETLICRTLGISNARDVLEQSSKGVPRPFPGSNWSFRTHGVGVDIRRGLDVGGIDFDFDKPDPDPWRLHLFAEKQLRAGNLPIEEYGAFVGDDDRFHAAAERVLGVR